MTTTSATEKDKKSAQRCVECPDMPRRQESSSEGSLIGLSRISKTAYAPTAQHMRGFTGKKLMRLDRRNKVNKKKPGFTLKGTSPVRSGMTEE